MSATDQVSLTAAQRIAASLQRHGVLSLFGQSLPSAQEIDHLTLFDGCVKWIRRVSDGVRVEDYVDQAFVAASRIRIDHSCTISPMISAWVIETPLT